MTATDLLNLELSTLQLGLALAGLGLVYLAIKYHDRGVGVSRRPDLETRKGWPLIGNLPEIYANRTALQELWIKAHKEAKHPEKFLSMTAPGRRIIDITRPDLLQFVQKDGFRHFVKGEMFHENMKDILGDGIFNVDGALWHTQRKATARAFTGNSFRGVITNSIDSHMQKLVEIVKRHAESGQELHLDKLFFRFTLETFGSMAFGLDIGALDPDNDEPVPFAEAFDHAQELLDRRFNDPFWKINEKLSSRGREMKAAQKVLDDFCYKVIDQRSSKGLGNETKDTLKEDKSGTLDLLSIYMSLNAQDGKPLNRKQLRDALLNLIIAGRDTTAQALSWTFYFLLKQKHDRGEDWITKVRQELDSSGLVDYDSFRSLPVTNAVFNAALLRQPSVPKNGWQAISDVQMPDGPFVKAGDFVFWSDWRMARDESIWGDAAHKYSPELFLKTSETGELEKKEYSQWQNHVFNGGYRLCLGQDLAKYEAVSVLAVLFKDFEFDFADDYLEKVEKMQSEDTPRYRPSLTLPMNEPLRVVVRRRQTTGAKS
ncbi:hypothetical protein OIV83_003607 [Microbotryomycetes sp. JL201]|nr:hypothetical protein OIV83_003607 [Microbotryomycetes sp. JL201]